MHLKKSFKVNWSNEGLKLMTLQITSNPWNAKKNILRVNNFIHFETMEISYSSDISELSVTPSI